jgi:hypothetical protein
MLRVVGLVALHVACIYFLWLLWKDTHEANRRGRIFTKTGTVSRIRSQRLFRFSIWADFVVLLLLYIVLVVYSVARMFK